MYLIEAALIDNSKFLVAAQKCRRATSTDYHCEDMSRGSNTFVGKLRYEPLSPIVFLFWLLRMMGEPLEDSVLFPCM